MSDLIPYKAPDSYITRTPDIAGGKPCPVGRRIRVQDVYVWHEHNGMSADEIASEYNLTFVEVYAALAYAFENLEAIRRDIQHSEENAAEIQQKYPSKLA